MTRVFSYSLHCGKSFQSIQRMNFKLSKSLKTSFKSFIRNPTPITMPRLFFSGIPEFFHSPFPLKPNRQSFFHSFSTLSSSLFLPSRLSNCFNVLLISFPLSLLLLLYVLCLAMKIHSFYLFYITCIYVNRQIYKSSLLFLVWLIHLLLGRQPSFQLLPMKPLLLWLSSWSNPFNGPPHIFDHFSNFFLRSIIQVGYSYIYSIV